jgi:hypothetical protein
MQTFIRALGSRNAGLQEAFIGFYLRGEKIGNIQDIMPLTKVITYPFFSR